MTPEQIETWERAKAACEAKIIRNTFKTNSQPLAEKNFNDGVHESIAAIDALRTEAAKEGEAMTTYDHSNDHLHRTFIRNGYVTLYWPKNATVSDLEHIRAVVNWQLDIFLKSARKETEAAEAARLEYESWEPRP